MICRTCKEEFDPKKRRHRFGFFNQCDDCGILEKQEPDRYIGRRGEKGIGTEIFRTNLKGIEGFIKAENQSFGPLGLQLGNVQSTAEEKTDWDTEKTKEEAEDEKAASWEKKENK